VESAPFVTPFNANAIKNAIRVAAQFSGGRIKNRIEAELQALSAGAVSGRSRRLT